MTAQIDPQTLKARLGDGGEIALLDVSEHGQYGGAHPFFAVPLPYSRFEIGLPALVPNLAVRLVVCDEGDGVAERAAARAQVLGYRNTHVLCGGKPAWRRAGFTLFAGVNVPSKAFGELVAHARATPQVTAQELRAMQDAGENLIVVDGRPFAEYQKMSIPGGICCPNGELALRIKEIAPDRTTRIVVNCAGRTRSIIGAQTLRELGVPNPVFALENGTQGWFLAGLGLEHGASHTYPDRLNQAALMARRTRAHQFAQQRGVITVCAETAAAWCAERDRTTYLLDVRTAEEYAAWAVPGFVHAPGGQLIQATDQWIGIRGARLVLADVEMVRAPVIAGWLRQLGHEACVLDGGLKAAISWPRAAASDPLLDLPAIGPHELVPLLADHQVRILDVRASMAFRKGHIAQAPWSIRPRIAAALDGATRMAVLVAEDPSIAALAAVDLREAGVVDIRRLTDDVASWRAAGLQIVATPDDPSDADCIDFLFFAHKRHEGDADAARQYLAWETGLIDQLDAQERGAFRLAAL